MSVDVPAGSALAPLLIMGSPRSGTTFLAHMVNRFLDIHICRNAYGRQLESSIRTGSTILPGGPMEMVFIRAPKIEAVGEGVEVLATEGGDPVLVRRGTVMAATFHPELSGDTRVHAAFLELARNGSH